MRLAGVLGDARADDRAVFLAVAAGQAHRCRFHAAVFMLRSSCCGFHALDARAGVRARSCRAAASSARQCPPSSTPPPRWLCVGCLPSSGWSTPSTARWWRAVAPLPRMQPCDATAHHRARRAAGLDALGQAVDVQRGAGGKPPSASPADTMFSHSIRRSGNWCSVSRVPRIRGFSANAGSTRGDDDAFLAIPVVNALDFVAFPDAGGNDLDVVVEIAELGRETFHGRVHRSSLAESRTTRCVGTTTWSRVTASSLSCCSSIATVASIIGATLCLTVVSR